MNNLPIHKKPHSNNAERSVLGSMMIDSHCIPKVIAIIDEECFYHYNHRYIYSAIIGLFERNIEPDLMTISEELLRRGRLETIGGTIVLTEINIASPTASNVEQYCYIILEYHMKRSLMDIGAELISRGASNTTDALEEIDNAEARIFRIAERRLRRSFYSAEELSIKVFYYLTEMMQKELALSGVPSGFTHLDTMLSGFQKSDFIVIAARPSMGKTAFALSICRNAALYYNIPVAIFSLEMAGSQLMQRLISAQSGVHLSKFRNGKTEYDMQPIMEAINTISEATILIDDSPTLTIVELRAKCRRLKAEHNIQLIVIDYLQLISAKAENREREISHISRSLKQIAKELDIPVIALSQLNRSVESRADKIPLLSDLRESGSIEQDADVVLFVNRREYYGIINYEDGVPTEGTAEITVAKQRSGPTGEIRLAFVKELALFANLTTNTELPVHKTPTLIEAF